MPSVRAILLFVTFKDNNVSGRHLKKMPTRNSLEATTKCHPRPNLPITEIRPTRHPPTVSAPILLSLLMSLFMSILTHFGTETNTHTLPMAIQTSGSPVLLATSMSRAYQCGTIGIVGL
jgi:hypothetical protein